MNNNHRMNLDEAIARWGWENLNHRKIFLASEEKLTPLKDDPNETGRLNIDTIFASLRIREAQLVEISGVQYCVGEQSHYDRVVIYKTSWCYVYLTGEQKLDMRAEALIGKYIIYDSAANRNDMRHHPAIIAGFDRSTGLIIQNPNTGHKYVCLHGPNSPLVKSGKEEETGAFLPGFQYLVETLEGGALIGWKVIEKFNEILHTTTVHGGAAPYACSFAG